jgi:hypothetical protein
MESAEGAAFVARFFKLVLPTAEYRKFRAHLKIHETLPEVLGEIMEEIQAQMQDFTEDVAERPTEPSSPSSSGRTAMGERTLQIVSIPEGDVAFVPPAAPDGSVAVKPNTRKRKTG